MCHGFVFLNLFFFLYLMALYSAVWAALVFRFYWSYEILYWFFYFFFLILVTVTNLLEQKWTANKFICQNIFWSWAEKNTYESRQLDWSLCFNSRKIKIKINKLSIRSGFMTQKALSAFETSVHKVKGGNLWSDPNFVFLFIALSSCCYTERSMILFFFFFLFQCYYFSNWNAILKMEQEMAIQHLTVLRKFPLQCYNLLCHCERLDKSIRWKMTLKISLACLLHVW